MADEPKKNASLGDLTFGVGEGAGGQIETFPLSELPGRVAERDRQAAAIDHAVEQSQSGFPPSLDEEQDEDFADLIDPADLEDGEAD